MITNNFESPYVVNSGNPRNPTAIRHKRFKKGEIISGVMQMTNGKPNFVLYNDVVVIPLSVIKAVVTKEILSDFSGAKANTIPNGQETTKNFIIQKDPKTRYMDTAIVGAVLGLAVVYLANKKQWIKVPMPINFAYGAGVGAALGIYFIYRQNNKPKTKIV